jgi:hypothetical protein
MSIVAAIAAAATILITVGFTVWMLTQSFKN